MRYLVAVLFFPLALQAQSVPGEVLAGQYYTCLANYDQARQRISDAAQGITYCRGRRGLPLNTGIAAFPGQIYGIPFRAWIGYTAECELHVSYAKDTAALFEAEKARCINGGV